MKRTKLRKKSKASIRKIQDILWTLCRQLTFAKYGNTCYTCGARRLEGSNLQCGHMIPKASCGANLKYDLRNLRPQCMRCNIHLGGNGAEFYRKMMLEVGPTALNEILIDKQKTVKAYDHYVFLISKYQSMI